MVKQLMVNMFSTDGDFVCSISEGSFRRVQHWLKKDVDLGHLLGTTDRPVGVLEMVQ